MAREPRSAHHGRGIYRPPSEKSRTRPLWSFANVKIRVTRCRHSGMPRHLMVSRQDATIRSTINRLRQRSTATRHTDISITVHRPIYRNRLRAINERQRQHPKTDTYCSDLNPISALRNHLRSLATKLRRHTKPRRRAAMTNGYARGREMNHHAAAST